MGTIHFQLPSAVSEEGLRELERSCLTGSPDNMPWPTVVQIEDGRLSLRRRNLDESGCLVAPWAVAGFGRVMGASSTLMERPHLYQLQTELARGKIHQLRGQAWEWSAIGLQVPPELSRAIREASSAFGRTVTNAPSVEMEAQAQTALELGYGAADQLVRFYIDQLLFVRHQRQARFDTLLSCAIGPTVPAGPAAAVLEESCNAIRLPFTWSAIEPVEGSYHWETCDALLDWARSRKLPVVGGPLVDFSAAHLPEWLWLWEHDTDSLTRFVCGFVETVLNRYRDHIPCWNLTTASNSAAVLTLRDDELLFLTLKAVETARRAAPNLEIQVGIAQPWGEYLAQREPTRSPFLFCDELIRSGLRIDGLDLEIVMGVAPRGSYYRDLLEVSRLLDLYALLGVPLSVTLGCPSAKPHDPLADPEMRVAAGTGRDGFHAAAQAEWANVFAELILAKPYVRALHWAHLSDAEPHQFPHCGLLDAEGSPKPVAQSLRRLRETHLLMP